MLHHNTLFLIGYFCYFRQHHSNYPDFPLHVYSCTTISLSLQSSCYKCELNLANMAPPIYNRHTLSLSLSPPSLSLGNADQDNVMAII